jgi:hypothetical protein
MEIVRLGPVALELRVELHRGSSLVRLLGEETFEIGANAKSNLFGEFELHGRTDGFDLDNCAQRPRRGRRYGNVDNLVYVAH